MTVPPEKLAAIVLFLIPWVMSLIELHRGWTKGELKEYSRSSYQELGDSSDKPDVFCRRKEHPKTFWCLFLFYAVITIIIPIGIGYAITNQS